MKSQLATLLNTRTMTLIVSLPRNDADLSRAAFDAGADAVKVHCNIMHRASGSGFGPLSAYAEVFEQILSEAKGPVGLVPGAAMEDVQRDMPEAAQLPFDFFSVYAHHAPASLLKNREMLMLALGHGDGPEDARALAGLQVPMLEASVIAADGYGAPLSAKDVAMYQGLCTASPVPIVVPTQRSIAPEDLLYLYHAGVKGIMIGAIVTGTEQSSIVRSVAAFRNVIDKGLNA
ncbi:MAG: hypothetical protein ACOX58_13815 [Christensenellales bacterium]|jgi:hypothetical protein